MYEMGIPLILGFNERRNLGYIIWMYKYEKKFDFSSPKRISRVQMKSVSYLQKGPLFTTGYIYVEQMSKPT